LIAWQLADQVRLEVFKVTQAQALDADHRLRSQIDDAAGSICRHIAEALSADRDLDFARFVRRARASVTDVQDGFNRAVLKKYLAETDLRDARELLSRLYPALSWLLADCSASSQRLVAPSRTD